MFKRKVIVKGLSKPLTCYHEPYKLPDPVFRKPLNEYWQIWVYGKVWFLEATIA